MEGVRRKVTAKLTKDFNSKTQEEWLEGRGHVPWGGLVNRIAFLEYPSCGRGITLALLGPRDWNQDRWIKGSRRREGENEDWAQGANTLYDRTVNLRLPSCRTARSSLEAANESLHYHLGNHTPSWGPSEHHPRPVYCEQPRELRPLKLTAS